MTEWRRLKLGAVITLKRGHDIRAVDRKEGTIPVVSSSGIVGYHNEAKVSAPGVVTGRYGTIGEVFFISEPFWPSNTTLYVEDFKGNDARFVFYLLQQIDFRKYSDKTGVPGINRNDVHKAWVLLPPLPEQRAIAAVLGTWDRAIALTERRLAAAEQRKQALMQQLLTGRVRFSEFVKSTEKQETKYGDLPTDWKYVPLRQVAREVKTKNAAEHDYPVLSCTKYDGLVDSLEYFGRQIYSDDLSTYKVVRERQFAYATNHIEEGSIGYQDLHEVALISPMYTVFETNDQVDDSFLYKVLKTEKYRHIFEVNTNGTVNRRGSLRWGEFSQIHVPLPTLAEQRRIAAVLNTCDRELDLLRRRRDALQQQKKGLMQRLLTGRVRVKV